MPTERNDKPPIPPWAERERADDLFWIAENLHVLWPAAQACYEEFGRGAVVIDTRIVPEGATGHPMSYLTQEDVNEIGYEDEIRIVAEYDPTWELVSMLIKRQGRTSTYRVGVPSQRGAQ